MPRRGELRSLVAGTGKQLHQERIQSEQGLPPADEYESIRVSFPNRNYDPEKGPALYDRFLDERLIAEDEGREIVLNEHHQTATCVDHAAPLVLPLWLGSHAGHAC